MRTGWHFLVATIALTTSGYRADASRDAVGQARTQSAEPHSQLAVLADSERDFGGRQGGSGWYYGYVKANALAEFIPFPVFAVSPHSAPVNRQCWSLFRLGEPIPETFVYSCLTSLGGHPNKSADARPDQWVVRRWISSVTANLRIEGVFGDLGPDFGAGGDGVEGTVLVDGVPVWTESTSQHTADHPFFCTAQVKPGSTVDFRVAPKENGDCDGFFWTAKILTTAGTAGTLTQSPTTAAAAEASASHAAKRAAETLRLPALRRASAQTKMFIHARSPDIFVLDNGTVVDLWRVQRVLDGAKRKGGPKGQLALLRPRESHVPHAPPWVRVLTRDDPRQNDIESWELYCESMVMGLSGGRVQQIIEGTTSMLIEAMLPASTRYDNYFVIRSFLDGSQPLAKGQALGRVGLLVPAGSAHVTNRLGAEMTFPQFDFARLPRRRITDVELANKLESGRPAPIFCTSLYEGR